MRPTENAIATGTWDMDLTRHLIETVFDRDQMSLARPFLKSVVDRQDFAHYHYQEAGRLLKQFSQTYLTDKHLVEIVFDDESRVPFEELMTQLGAHSIACIQSLHSVPDIFAHMLYYSLGLNRTVEIKERSIAAASVQKKLAAEKRFQSLGFALTQLTTGEQFHHLSALANHSKHRSIVQPQLNEDWTGLRESRHEVRFSDFTYQEQVFPAISIESLLAPEYAKSSRITVNAGRHLNHVLSTMLP